MPSCSLRLAISVITLAVAFVLGMFFAQRAPLAPAHAAENTTELTCIPVKTIVSKTKDDQHETVTTTVEEVLVIYANGGGTRLLKRERNFCP